MGIWSTSISLGNVLGQQTAAIVEQTSDLTWEYVLIITTIYILISAALFTIVPDKPDSSLLPSSPQLSESLNQLEIAEESPVLSPKKLGISFSEAVKLPG